jgi:hypothetical protein
MRETDEPVRIHRDNAGELIIVPSRHEPDLLDSVSVEFSGPTFRLLLARSRLGFRLREIEGQPPLLAGPCKLRVAEPLTFDCGGALDPPRYTGPVVAALRHIALDREMRVPIEDMEILVHRLPSLRLRV